MILKVKVTILRKRPTLSSIVRSLEIFLNDQTKIMLHLQRPTSFHKFRHRSERVVRVLNLYKKGINFLRAQDCYNMCMWTSWEWEEIEKEFEIGSSDLDCVKFSLEQRKIVKNALDRKLKISHNPSKPKSDMEYRKRAYYGKCKK